MSHSTTFFLLSLLILAVANSKEAPKATMTKDNVISKLSSFLQAKMRASDAVDTVLNLLNDLRQANVNEQEAADQLNKTQEAEGLQQIAELTDLRDKLRKVFDDATAHKEWIITQFTDTTNYIDWILKRQQDVINQLATLSEHRCYSNALFIKALKEHNDALSVIDFLIEDLKSKQASGESLLFAEIKDIPSKLKAYTSLFNSGALDQFLQLASGRDQWEDNDKSALDVAGFKSETESRDVKGGLIGRIIGLLEDLKQHLKESILNLQEHEIKANFDFAEWQTSVEAENKTLNAELERKKTYLSKLEIDLEVAKGYEERAEKDWNQSVKALQGAIDDLEAKRAYYAQETARRNAENAILDEVIEIFKSKVTGIADYLRSRIEDQGANRIGRLTDEQISGQSGKTAEQVGVESTA